MKLRAGTGDGAATLRLSVNEHMAAAVSRAAEGRSSERTATGAETLDSVGGFAVVHLGNPAEHIVRFLFFANVSGLCDLPGDRSHLFRSFHIDLVQVFVQPELRQ